MNKEYYQTIHAIIVTGHWITDQVSKELKIVGITEPQYNVLRILAEVDGGPLTVEEILKGMVQRSSNITRIVDKLVSKDFVERKECPSNRRKMDISLTKSGRAMLKKCDKTIHAFHDPMTNKLSSKELKTLKDLITKLKFLPDV